MRSPEGNQYFLLYVKYDKQNYFRKIHCCPPASTVSHGWHKFWPPGWKSCVWPILYNIPSLCKVPYPQVATNHKDVPLQIPANHSMGGCEKWALKVHFFTTCHIPQLTCSHKPSLMSAWRVKVRPPANTRQHGQCHCSVGFALCSVYYLPPYNTLKQRRLLLPVMKSVLKLGTVVHGHNTQPVREGGQYEPTALFLSQGVVSLWGNLALESRNFYVVQIQQGLAVWFKGRMSGVCQLWFIKTNIKSWPLLPGPTSSRAAYPSSAVARTRPSLPPAALTPCTLLLAAGCTPTAQRLTRPKNSRIKKMHSESRVSVDTGSANCFN